MPIARAGRRRRTPIVTTIATLRLARMRSENFIKDSQARTSPPSTMRTHVAFSGSSQAKATMPINAIWVGSS